MYVLAITVPTNIEATQMCVFTKKKLLFDFDMLISKAVV